MSGGTICRCEHGRTHWACMQYKCNHSAFNGYHYTPSDYSEVTCMACGSVWRTKAAYVAELPMWTQERERVVRAEVAKNEHQ